MSDNNKDKRKRYNKKVNEKTKKKQKTEDIVVEYTPSPPYVIYEDEDDDYEEEYIEKETLYLPKVYLNLDLNNIDDLIKVGIKYINNEYCNYKKYNINLYKLSKLVIPLKKLKNMIGMESVKSDVFELLLYQLQDFDNSKDMLHTIIEGEPGVGKTEVAKIIAEIYQEMGYCHNDIIKFVKRSDLIGGYLGQTAIKTQKVLDQCKGGILIIDEAYSLGNKDRTDSYSKECIDTLTRFLSESPDTIVFVMGYKQALQECLFNHNKGLERRFTYRFTIHKYSSKELKNILFKIIKENNWFIENEIPDSFFEENREYFKFNGGDMLNLFTKCKFTHSIRFFNLNKKSTEIKNYDKFKKHINFEDIQNGLKLLLKDKNFSNRKENKTTHHFMYS